MSDNKPQILKEKISQLFESKFMNVYEYPFGQNGHYYTASRRKADDIVMLKQEKEYQEMTPDAVTMIVIIKEAGKEPMLLMNYEFRYALGNFVMAPPAGLVDPEDRINGDPLIMTAIREVKEETGIEIKESDRVFTVNPLLFSSPGMTDESNGIVCCLINSDPTDAMNHDGSLGSEVFDGFELLNKTQASQALREGRDKNGNFYSVYTWISLMYFVSGLWEDHIS